MISLEELLRTGDVAVRLSVDQAMVRKYIEAGELKAVKHGKYWEINEEALAAFEQTRQAARLRASRARPVASGLLPRFPKT